MWTDVNFINRIIRERIGCIDKVRYSKIFPSTHSILLAYATQWERTKKIIIERPNNYLNWCTLFQKINIKNDPKRRTVQYMHTIKVEVNLYVDTSAFLIAKLEKLKSTFFKSRPHPMPPGQCHCLDHLSCLLSPTLQPCPVGTNSRVCPG